VLIDVDEENYASARATAEELLPAIRRAGYLRVEAEALLALAICSSVDGRHEKAASLLEASLQTWQSSDR
jgi:hypothetical protein